MSEYQLTPEEIWKAQQGNCYWDDADKGVAVAQAQLAKAQAYYASLTDEKMQKIIGASFLREDEELTYQIASDLFKAGYLSPDEVAEKDAIIERQGDKLDVLLRERDGEAWYWQGDGEDHLESLICPILIEAQDLRDLVAEKVKDERERIITILDRKAQDELPRECPWHKWTWFRERFGQALSKEKDE